MTGQHTKVLSLFLLGLAALTAANRLDAARQGDVKHLVSCIGTTSLIPFRSPSTVGKRPMYVSMVTGTTVPGEGSTGA